MRYIGRHTSTFNSRVAPLGKAFGASLVCLWVVALTGCSNVPPTIKEQTRIVLNIKAADNVNPDDKDRAAPVQVRIYELKNDTAFNATDFYSLQDNDKAVLGDDLLASDEFILRPGETKTLRRRSNPETTVIAVLAGYRSLATSKWRESFHMEEAPYAAWYRAWPLSSVKLNVNIGQNAIVMTELD